MKCSESIQYGEGLAYKIEGKIILSMMFILLVIGSYITLGLFALFPIITLSAMIIYFNKYI